MEGIRHKPHHFLSIHIYTVSSPLSSGPRGEESLHTCSIYFITPISSSTNSFQSVFCTHYRTKTSLRKNTIDCYLAKSNRHDLGPYITVLSIASGTIYNFVLYFFDFWNTTLLILLLPYFFLLSSTFQHTFSQC